MILWPFTACLQYVPAWFFAIKVVMIWYMIWSYWSLIFSLSKYIVALLKTYNFHHMSFLKEVGCPNNNKNNYKFIAKFTLSGIENNNKPSWNWEQQTLYVALAILQCTVSLKFYSCDLLVHWAVFLTEANKDHWIDNQRCPKFQRTGKCQWYRHLLKNHWKV